MMKKMMISAMAAMMLMAPQTALAKTQKTVYLTFDDGPSRNTLKVLNILDKNHVKGTFFVTGQQPQCFPYIKMMAQKGHAIGLHTYSHNYAKVYASVNAFNKDLDQIQKVVVKETGHQSKLVRFPGGTNNTVSRHYGYKVMTKLTRSMNAQGYNYIDWNVETGDATGRPLSPTQLAKNACVPMKNVVILMHDTSAKDNTVKALPMIIQYYKDRGYTFKKVNANTRCRFKPAN
ncbi:hypothetical protein SG0102_26500 [Intestinibaculum porci]|uniref:NodB homology domain-containing protein n=1 Tax=Intestinibaculum porci TaxID=2487118 RepID=A0A3G9JAV8_9FIRM|nr:polysaccharide deacetylase family protein [Intestinibaculum porci]BBH27716.1 hypothetical protein SG0102_26500 [Intestinibaculum porci]